MKLNPQEEFELVRNAYPNPNPIVTTKDRSLNEYEIKLFAYIEESKLKLFVYWLKRLNINLDEDYEAVVHDFILNKLMIEKVLKKFTYNGNLNSYLIKCLTNFVKTESRKRKAKKRAKQKEEISLNTTGADKDTEIGTLFQSPEPEPHENIQKNEVRKILHDIINNELDNRKKIIVNKKYFEDMEFPDIARILSIDKSYVSKLTKKALGKIECESLKKGIDSNDSLIDGTPDKIIKFNNNKSKRNEE